MDRSMIFKLLTATRTQNSFGAWTETITARTVYGQVTSVSREEFFAGGQNGFKPEYRIVMFGPDYEGEMRCEIDGVEYSVYRVYRGRTDRVELYVEKRTGDRQPDPEPEPEPEVPET